MVGKGKAIAHTKASVLYGWNEEKDAKVVFKNHLVGENPTEIADEFKFIQKLNQNCTKNTLSFIISPTIEDGRKMSLKDFNRIVNEFIKEFKLENHQAISFLHNDKKHKHLHLYVNRINFEGKAYNDSYIGSNAMKTAERVAEKLQLKTVKQVKEEKLENLKDIRKYIKSIHESCLKFYKPNNYQAYINEMAKHQIFVKPVINKQNKLQGFRYQFRDISLKGSEVHRSMSINKFKNTTLHKKQIITSKNYGKNRRSNGITRR